MKQMEQDPALQAMISEMFFEQHFTDATVCLTSHSLHTPEAMSV